MTVNAITDTKKGRTGIAPTYLHTTPTPRFIVTLSQKMLQGHCTKRVKIRSLQKVQGHRTAQGHRVGVDVDMTQPTGGPV